MLAVLAVAPYLLQLHNPARVPVSDAPSSDNGQLARIIDVETTTTPPIRHSFDQFIFTCRVGIWYSRKRLNHMCMPRTPSSDFPASLRPSAHSLPPGTTPLIDVRVVLFARPRRHARGRQHRPSDLNYNNAGFAA